MSYTEPAPAAIIARLAREAKVLEDLKATLWRELAATQYESAALRTAIAAETRGEFSDPPTVAHGERHTVDLAREASLSPLPADVSAGPADVRALSPLSAALSAPQNTATAALDFSSLPAQLSARDLMRRPVASAHTRWRRAKVKQKAAKGRALWVGCVSLCSGWEAQLTRVRFVTFVAATIQGACIPTSSSGRPGDTHPV